MSTKKRPSKPTNPKQPKPWMAFAGMVQSGDPQSSQRIDELIYGHKG